MKYRNLLFYCRVPRYIGTTARFNEQLKPVINVSEDPAQRDFDIEVAARLLAVSVRQLQYFSDFSISSYVEVNQDREQLYFNYLWHLHDALNRLLAYAAISNQQAVSYDHFFKHLYNHWFDAVDTSHQNHSLVLGG